jgi:hypothetical protein
VRLKYTVLSIMSLTKLYYGGLDVISDGRCGVLELPLAVLSIPLAAAPGGDIGGECGSASLEGEFFDVSNNLG